MNRNEDFLDRLRRQEGWNLSSFSEVTLALCGCGTGTAMTLSLAALSSGITHQVLIGPDGESEKLWAVADRVMDHLGYHSEYIPVHSAGFSKLRKEWGKEQCVWIIDTGDPRLDSICPSLDDNAFYYSQGCGPDGKRWLAFGTDRDEVSRYRECLPIQDRAEVPNLCSHLLIGMMAGLKVCAEIEPLPAVARIPLSEIPRSPQIEPSSLLYCGGGGAIAHQELWAESLDPILRMSAQKGHMIIVDPKHVHESCRARQWAYGPDDVGESKAGLTAEWVRRLFPGIEAQGMEEKLRESCFQMVPIKEAISSVDNWTGRRTLADLAARFGVAWWSSGSSFFGGFARHVSAGNPFCASAYEGVERIGEREDGPSAEGTSCTGPATPLPSSVLPQMILGSFMASQRREMLLGRADQRVVARGIEVHITHDSKEPGYEGLRFSPGRLFNLRQRPKARI